MILHCFTLLIPAASLLIFLIYLTIYLYKIYRTFCYHLNKFVVSVIILIPNIFDAYLLL